MAAPSQAWFSRIRPVNASRQFSAPSPILRKARVVALLEHHRGADVVEVGAGCLRNARYLLGLGFRVTVLEVRGIEERFPEAYRSFSRRGGTLLLADYVPDTGRFSYSKRLPKGSFDLGVLTFVIETIPLQSERVRLLKMIGEALRPGGSLLLSARGPSDLVTATAKGTRAGDGFITPNRTFARAFTKAQLEGLMKKGGFRHTTFLHAERVAAPELVDCISRDWRA